METCGITLILAKLRKSALSLSGHMYHIPGKMYLKLANTTVYLIELVIEVTLENVCKS